MKHFQPVGEVVETEVPVLDDDARLVLREDFRMRREDHFVSFWRVGDDATVWDHMRIDPSTAVMIALFDGKRTVGQVIRDFTWAAKVSEKDARIALGRFMNDDEGRLIPTDGIPEAKHCRYDPRSFIIPFPEVSITRKRTFAPLSLVWMITNTCVADCIYCFAERQRHGKGGPLLSLSRVIEILDEAADLHIGGIVVEGGDPFMHPQIVEIIEAMIARDIHVAVSTKCGLSEEMIGRLSDVGLRRLQVSIDTLDEQTHAFLTQSPGLLPKTLATAEHALAAGFSTLVNAVLTPHNLHQIRPLVEKLVSMGVYSINFSEYVRSAYVTREDLFLTSEQCEEATRVVEALKEKYEDRNIRVERPAELPFAERAICTAGINGLTIHPDGKSVLCEQAPSEGPSVVGDLSHQSLKEIWNSDRVDAFLLPDQSLFAGTACENCEEFEECHVGRGRCFIQSFKAYGTVFAPQPDCPRAPRPKVRPWSEAPDTHGPPASDGPRVPAAA